MSGAQGQERGTESTAAETLERELSLGPPSGSPVPRSLRPAPPGRKVYSGAGALGGGSCVHAALPPARGARLPPCAVGARREGASPQDSAAGRGPRPRPAPGADPSRSGAAPEPRGPPAPGGGTVSPPAPSPGHPASYPWGPRPSALGEPRLTRKLGARGGCERACLGERAGVCPPRALHAPGQRGRGALEIRPRGTRPGRERTVWRPAEGARVVLPSARERGGPWRRTEPPWAAALGRRVPAPGLSALAASRLDTWVLRQHKTQVSE